MNLCLLAGLQTAHAAEKLTVREFAGAVKLKIDDRWQDPRVDMAVALPAIVSTGANGSIELVQGETIYSVTANTALELFAAADGQLVKRVVQNKGSAFYDVSDRKQRNFRVETPYLVAVIKGTQFNVTVEAEMASVALFEGLLHIEAPDTGEVIELQAGFIARRHKGDAGITVIRMDDGEPVAATRIKPPSNPANDNSDDTAGQAGSGQQDAVADSGTAGGGIAIVSDEEETQLGLSAGTDLDGFGDDPGFVADFDPELDPDIAADLGDLGVEVAFGGGDLSAELGSDLTAELGADLGAELNAELGAGDLDVGLDADLVGGGLSADLGADIGASDLDVDLDVGVDTDLASGDLSADLGAVIGAGDLDVDLDAGVDADLTGGDLNADLGADLGAGDLDVGLDAGIDTDLAGGDLSADLGAAIGAGDLDVDLDAGVDADLAGGDLSADLGADVGAGDLDAGLDGGVDADLAGGDLSADLGADVGVGGLDADVDAGVDADLADGDAGLDVGVGNLGLDVGLDGGGLDLGLDLDGDDPSGDAEEDEEEEDPVPLLPDLGNLLGL